MSTLRIWDFSYSPRTQNSEIWSSKIEVCMLLDFINVRKSNEEPGFEKTLDEDDEC
jgi:hypothetical protein